MDNFFLFLAAYLPFQLAINPAAGVDLASIRVLILGAFFVWLAKSLKNKKIFLPKNIKTIFIVSFLFLSLLSAFVADNVGWSVRKLAFLLSIFPLYFIASEAINSPARMEKTVKYLILSGGLAALIGIIQFLSQFFFGLEKVYDFWATKVAAPFFGESFSQSVLKNPSWLVNIAGKTYLRATSVFPDPHMLSFYLGMLIPLAFGVAIFSKRQRLFQIALIILVVADLLTFSRGGYLGLFFGIVFLTPFFWSKINRTARKVVLITLVGISLTMIISNPVSQRFFSSFDLKEGSNTGRIETWQKAIKVTASNPLLGVGIGNYPLAIKPTASYREPIYAHNTYLDIAAESGLIAMLVWLGFLASALVNFYSKRKENALFLMSAASILVFGIHSLVETGIYSVNVLPLLLIITSFGNNEIKK